MRILLVCRGESFRKGDVNTRNTGSSDFETEELIVRSTVLNVIDPLCELDAEVTVFVDAVFKHSDEVAARYTKLWRDALAGKCHLKLRIRKRLSAKTQKMGIVQTMKYSKSDDYDVTIVTRNNMIWKRRIPFLPTELSSCIGLLSYNSLDFAYTRSGRTASRGMWHDYLRVEDKYIIVPRVRHDELVAWLVKHSDNVEVTQGMHDISSPICGLPSLAVAWQAQLSSNTSLMDNPLYELCGRPVGRPYASILGPPLWQPLRATG